MKRIVLILLALFPLAWPLAAQTPPASPIQEQLVDRVIAVVGDTALLLSAVDDEVGRLREVNSLPNDQATVEQLRRTVVEDKINQLLLLTAAKDAGTSISDDQVTRLADE